MPEIEIETNASSVAIRYQDAAKLMPSSIVKALRDVGQYVVRVIVRDKLRGGLLNARTGNLGRAIDYRVELDDTDATVFVGADLAKAKYARLQRFGGVITPKRAQKLWIPVGVALTGNGVARISPREFISNPGALGFDRMFIRPTAAIGVKGGVSEVVFARKDSVTIPGRDYLGEGLTDSLPWIQDRLGVAVDEGLAPLSESA